MKTEKLKEKYRKVCKKYVKKFMQIMGFDVSQSIDCTGGNYDFNGAWVFYFDSIIQVVNNEYTKNQVLSWYDYNSEEFRIKLSAYVKLYEDFEYKKGFGFKVEEFHRELNKFNS